jgi:hypothetical protein
MRQHPRHQAQRSNRQPNQFSRPHFWAPDLKIDSRLENERRVCPARIKHVGREMNVLVRETDQEATLSIEAGVVGFRSLCRETQMKPVC